MVNRAKPISVLKGRPYRFEKGSRYYELHVVKNLFGKLDILRINGAINGRRGRLVVEPFSPVRLRALVKRRLQRGYQMTPTRREW